MGGHGMPTCRPSASPFLCILTPDHFSCIFKLALSPLFFGFHASLSSSTVRDLPPRSASAFLVGEAYHRSLFQSKSDMGRSRARARQPLSNISMLALPRNQEPHDRFPFFSSLPSVSSQDVTLRDGHGRPMSERRRPRTRRHLDPLHAISISPETCTKSHPAPSPPFGPRPVALQPERFNRLVPEAEERSSLPRASPALANQQADPASYLFFRRDASPLRCLLRRGRRRQVVAGTRRWRTR
ncbi:hypothetical protein VPH35_137580 [Triticum aestivum]|nr:uncharacterized protein LOC123168825 [Triticum aestivum]